MLPYVHLATLEPSHSSRDTSDSTSVSSSHSTSDSTAARSTTFSRLSSTVDTKPITVQYSYPGVVSSLQNNSATTTTDVYHAAIESLSTTSINYESDKITHSTSSSVSVKEDSITDTMMSSTTTATPSSTTHSTSEVTYVASTVSDTTTEYVSQDQSPVDSITTDTSDSSTTTENDATTTVSPSITYSSKNQSTAMLHTATTSAEQLVRDRSTSSSVETHASADSSTSYDVHTFTATQRPSLQNVNITSGGTDTVSTSETTRVIGTKYVITSRSQDSTDKMTTSSTGQSPISPHIIPATSFSADTMSSSAELAFSSSENVTTAVSESVTTIAATSIPESVTLNEIGKIKATTESTASPESSTSTSEYAKAAEQHTSSRILPDSQHPTTTFVSPEIIQNGTTTSPTGYVSGGQKTDVLSALIATTEESVKDETSSAATDRFADSTALKFITRIMKFTTVSKHKSTSSAAGLITTTVQAADAATAEGYLTSRPDDRGDQTTDSAFRSTSTPAAADDFTVVSSPSAHSADSHGFGGMSSSSSTPASRNEMSTYLPHDGRHTTTEAATAHTVQDESKTSNQILSIVNTLPVELTSHKPSRAQTIGTALPRTTVDGLASSSTSASSLAVNASVSTTSQGSQSTTQSSVAFLNSTIDSTPTPGTVTRHASGESSVSVNVLTATATAEARTEIIDDHTSTQSEHVMEKNETLVNETYVVELTTSSMTTATGRSSTKPGDIRHTYGHIFHGVGFRRKNTTLDLCNCCSLNSQ